MNCQEIDVYVAKADGLYLYNAAKNSLETISSEDIRALTGKQPFVKGAPVNIILVADMSKMSRSSEESRNFYTAIDAGYVSQNIYLYCASQGLATVVRGNVDRDELLKAMKLNDKQKILVAQTVGYPLKKGSN
jgi:SagB-type dehydrogenase family enzyme